MKMAKAGNQGLVRINNQNAIIEYIRNHGPISRAELAKCLKISKPTVSTNVEALLQRNILLEMGPGSTTVGKKPTLLEFNHNHKLICACDLSREHTTLVIGDLKGNLIAEISVELCDGDSIEKQQTSITESLNALMLKAGIDQSKVAQVVIASPGIFPGQESGQLLNPQFEHLQAIQINNLLADYFDVEPKIKNDINMAALGEKFFGSGMHHSDLAYVSVGLGVGAGLIMNNTLYRGSRRAAGEIGFVVPLSATNTSGAFVNLENTIGEKAIEKRMSAERRLNKESLVFRNTQTPNFKEFIQAVHAGDIYCTNLANEMVDHLAIAIGNLSVVLDFELVVVGGSILSLGAEYLVKLEEQVNRITPLGTKVKASNLKAAEIYGAVKVGMDAILESLVNL